MLTELNYPLNLRILKKDADNLVGYRLVKGCIGDTHGMLIKTECSTYAKTVAAEFQSLISSTTTRPIFYLQSPGYCLKLHVDRFAKCSLNVLLSKDPAPISFSTGDVYYHTALINTSILHGVTNSSNETRILFKISVMDKTYQEVKEILQAHNLVKID